MKLPLWATVFTVISVAILLGLGTWQVKRMQWKNQIIAELDSAYNSERPDRLELDKAKDRNFSYGLIAGIFMPDKALLIGPRTKDGKVGKDLIVPVRVHGQYDLLVNLGWTEETDISRLPIHHAKGKGIRVTGLTRKPEWNDFTSENSPEQDLWFRADINQIAKAKDLKSPYPFLLYAETASYKFDAAFPNNERWYPRNKHLQYALFWYTMALALIVIYVIRFIWKK